MRRFCLVGIQGTSPIATTHSTRLVYVTAGAGGMFCGSCLHDNALAKAIRARGWDVLLVPLYTPIRTDEQDVSVDQVFLGGINVYLQQNIPLFRFLPKLLDRFLDSPRLIRRVTSRAIEIDASKLGAMTVSVLQGMQGNQRKEIRRLIDWLSRDAKPDVMVVSNLLIAGFSPEWKRRLNRPLLVTLQGDDVFLEGLTPEYRQRCLKLIQEHDSTVDGYIVHSEVFADRMADYFGLPRRKMHVTPLGIDTTDFERIHRPDHSTEEFRIGYLARLAPEKGLHQLVDAFLALQEMPIANQSRLEIAGWLGPEYRIYAENQFERLRQAGLSDRFRYHGVVDRRKKLEFLTQLDVFSVPTEQAEPKGLFVLEAMAAGTPVVQPAHGAFPEMLVPTAGGGRLVEPKNPIKLASAWQELADNPALRREMGQKARSYVLERRNGNAMAQSTMDVLKNFLPTRDSIEAS